MSRAVDSIGNPVSFTSKPYHYFTSKVFHFQLKSGMVFNWYIQQGNDFF